MCFALNSGGSYKKDEVYTVLANATSSGDCVCVGGNFVGFTSSVISESSIGRILGHFVLKAF